MGLAPARPAALTVSNPAQAAVDKAAVATTYADIAQAMYEDSLATAQALDAAIDALVAEPSAETLDAANAAWLAARHPYQQPEAYRSGTPIDAAWASTADRSPRDAACPTPFQPTYTLK